MRRLAAALMIAVVVVTPYAFPAYRAVVWQFPTQARIDQKNFQRTDLFGISSAPVLRQKLEDEAIYEARFRFGPRTYKNYVNRLKALDARDVEIEGKLRRQGKVVAWCKTVVPELASPNEYGEDERLFPIKLRALDSVDIPLTCRGPVDLARADGLELEWKLRVRLIGDREQVVREFRSKPTHGPALAAR
jgi:hypothetical protein